MIKVTVSRDTETGTAVRLHPDDPRMTDYVIPEECINEAMHAMDRDAKGLCETCEFLVRDDIPLILFIMAHQLSGRKRET